MSEDSEFVSTAELLAQELLAENKKLRAERDKLLAALLKVRAVGHNVAKLRAERDQFRAELTRMENENMRLRFPEDQVEMSRENRKLRAERDELHGKLVCETVIADQELQQFRAQRDKLLAALGEIAAMKGATLLGPDSRHRMGDDAPCYHERGANTAFEQCAAIADAAIANCKEKRGG